MSQYNGVDFLLLFCYDDLLQFLFDCRLVYNTGDCFPTVWTKEELCHALLPSWEKLYNQDPEGQPFQMPVDPIGLGIPVSLIYVAACRPMIVSK